MGSSCVEEDLFAVKKNLSETNIITKEGLQQVNDIFPVDSDTKSSLITTLSDGTNENTKSDGEQEYDTEYVQEKVKSGIKVEIQVNKLDLEKFFAQNTDIDDIDLTNYSDIDIEKYINLSSNK